MSLRAYDDCAFLFFDSLYCKRFSDVPVNSGAFFCCWFFLFDFAFEKQADVSQGFGFRVAAQLLRERVAAHGRVLNISGDVAGKLGEFALWWGLSVCSSGAVGSLALRFVGVNLFSWHILNITKLCVMFQGIV